MTTRCAGSAPSSRGRASGPARRTRRWTPPPSAGTTASRWEPSLPAGRPGRANIAVFKASGERMEVENGPASSSSPVVGPPPGAVLVEARDDRLVPTASYPPEAWLEAANGGPERLVRLNPVVTLNEYALRRLAP